MSTAESIQGTAKTQTSHRNVDNLPHELVKACFVWEDEDRGEPVIILLLIRTPSKTKNLLEQCHQEFGMAQHWSGERSTLGGLAKRMYVLQIDKDGKSYVDSRREHAAH